MKVFNLTDIETPALKARGWVDVPLTVGHHVIGPGQELEVGDTEIIRRDLLSYTTVGALSVGTRPPTYLVAQAARVSKARLEAAEGATRAKRKGK